MPCVPTSLEERQPDHLAFDQGRPAAVAGIDRRVDLKVQAQGSAVVLAETDAGDDPLGDRQAVPADRVAVDKDRCHHLG